MATRRSFLAWLGGIAGMGLGSAVYGFVIEPGLMLRTQFYKISPPRWTPGLKLRLVILSDPHMVEPLMPLKRWDRAISAANALEGDVILLLGDYVAGHFFRTGTVAIADIARSAAALKAPQGVYAVMGNHDWWDDRTAQKAGRGPILGQRAFEDAGIPVLENRAIRVTKDGRPFWLSGTASIVAIVKGRGRFESRADLDGTLAQITDDAPVIHLAHEPDLFVRMPERVSLTLSGHTHGGQVRLFGYSPMIPSQFGNRFAYGHIVEEGRHLVVSGGIGCSVLPVRFGVPPEITVIDLA